MHQEGNRLAATSIENFGADPKSVYKRLARRGTFTRMQGTDGGEKYILVGEKDTERGFTVVEYDTVNAAPAMFEDTRNLVRPSRIIYLRKASRVGAKLSE